MLSHQELIDIVATESAEAITARGPYELSPQRQYHERDTDVPVVNCNLLLVRHHDGRLEWED